MMYQNPKNILAKNLRLLLEESGKTQKEVANDLHILPTTFNTWCTGDAYPRANSIQLLADYFHVSVSDLVDQTHNHFGEEMAPYYSDKKTAAAAQEVFDDPNLHALFDAAKDSSPENIKLAAELLKRLKATNPEG